MKKVSIISPCYNGESYVARFLESVLKQTYDNIEFIIVDDGSTDGTKSIIRLYEPKFRERGYEFKYIYQENTGVGGALNLGLKHFTGEYFTWPDSDDEITETSITDKVEYLEKNPEFAFVRSAVYEIDEGTKKEKTVTSRFKKNKTEFLEDHIFGRETVYQSGAYMVRTEEFLKVFPTRSIYPSRIGQNTQILYPLAKEYVCGYLDKPLYKYYIRKNSLSHQDDTIAKSFKKFDEFKEIRKIVLTEMGLYEKYEFDVEVLYAKAKYNCAIAYNDKKFIKECFDNLNELRPVTKEEKNQYLVATSFLRLPVKFIRKLFEIIKRMFGK